MINRDTLKIVAIIVCLVGMLTFLFFKAKNNDIEKHHTIINQIHQLSYQDSQFNESILRLTTVNLRDYEFLNFHASEIEDNVAWIKSKKSGIYNRHGEDVDAAILSMERAFSQKLDLMLEFKLLNLALSLSLAELPIAIDDGKLGSSSLDQQIYLDRILKEVLLFHSNPLEHDNTWARTAIDQLRRSDEPKLMEISFNATRVIENTVKINTKVQKIFDVPTKQSISEVYSSYSRVYSGEMKAKSIYRFALYAMTLLLIVYLVELFMTLRNTMRHLEASLEEIEFQKKALDEYAIVASINPNGEISYVNDRFMEISQFGKGDINSHYRNLIDINYHTPSILKEITTTLEKGKTWRGELRNLKKDGGHYWADATVVPFIDKSGAPIRYIALLADTTSRKQDEQRIFKLAHYDNLTELPNRSYFRQKLEHHLSKGSSNGKKTALLFVDLDNFKSINDTLGHAVGDTLLRKVADHLVSSVRNNGVVSRLGGDEFTIALYDIESYAEIVEISDALLSITNRPISLDKHESVISASIGISVYPDDAKDIDTLIKNADMAMYAAKSSGKNQYQFFTQELEHINLKRHTLESDLRRAIQLEQFEIYYQPQVESATGSICSVEALIRWNHPENGLVPPCDFIPVLEETGLIVTVGDWVIKQACTQLAAWKEMGFSLRMAVNVSAHQIGDNHLLELVEQTLRFRSIEAHELDLELTETSLLKNSEYSMT